MPSTIDSTLRPPTGEECLVALDALSAATGAVEAISNLVDPDWGKGVVGDRRRWAAAPSLEDVGELWSLIEYLSVTVEGLTREKRDLEHFLGLMNAERLEAGETRV